MILFIVLYNIFEFKLVSIRYWKGLIFYCNMLKYKIFKKLRIFRKLFFKDELFLILNNICFGLLEDDLVDRFFIFVLYVFRIFIIWVKVLCKFFGEYVFNFLKEVVCVNLFFLFKILRYFFV